MVALEGNGARPSHRGSGYSEDNVSFTLNATEQHGVAYGIDRATYNMGQNAQFGIAVEEEVEPTMVAKGPGAVAHPVYTTSKNSYHTEAEADVANTLVATDYKPKTSKQIKKWLADPYSDSAEYKMWGNGVALPCVVFVLSGIVYYSQFPTA